MGTVATGDSCNKSYSSNQKHARVMTLKLHRVLDQQKKVYAESI